LLIGPHRRKIKIYPILYTFSDSKPKMSKDYKN
jgi:hypothetical protein